MVRTRIALACLAALTISACTGDGGHATSQGPIGLTTGASEFGDILVNGDGLTLYFLVSDRQSTPTCVDECESAWTPFRQEDLGALGPSVDADLVGSIERGDGIVQVTYNRWPLYRFRDDADPGDMNGHGELNAWFALGPNGGAVGVTE